MSEIFRHAMELREEEIAKHYEAALAMLDGFDHAPRIASGDGGAPAPERSPGIGSRRRFRSTTPGLVTRRTERPEGVHLIVASFEFFHHLFKGVEPFR